MDILYISAMEMKILHICNDYLYTKLYCNLLKGLEKQNVNNTVFVSTWRKDKSCDDSHVVVKRCYNFFDRFFFYVKERKVLGTLEKNFRVCEYDVYHAHNLFSDGYVAYKLHQKMDKPYIVAVRNTDMNHFFKQRFWLRKRGVEVLKNAEKVIFLSPSYEEKVLKKYVSRSLRNQILEKSTILPNGIDAFWHENIQPEQERKLTSKHVKILYVGQICKNKNVLTTLETCRILINKGYKVNFGVVGEAMDKRIVKRLLENKFVCYYGRKAKEELIEIYRQYDIFVMPSFYETFGLVYVEAMSQGLPVIYTRGQGFDRQFEDGTVGYAVNAKSAQEIFEKILLICRNYNEISNNCKRCAARFDWEKISKEYKALYEQVRG